LVVCRPIGKSKWEKTLLRDAVVVRRWGTLERNGYSKRFNVNDIKEETYVPSDADVGTAVDHLLSLQHVVV
jgi:hypothetical protein